MFAVVTALGSHLVQIKALHEEKTVAEADKKNFPHPFGTFVYPVNGGRTYRVGMELHRNKEFEN